MRSAGQLESPAADPATDQGDIVTTLLRRVMEFSGAHIPLGREIDPGTGIGR